MLHVRTVLGIALVPVLLSLTVTTAVAGWQLTFEPDVSTFKIKDVITGRTHIRYLAKGRDSGGQSVSVRCAEVQFLVTGPDGSTIAVIQKSRNDHAESWPINLSDREEVLLPVCLAKWAGQFVFSIEGECRFELPEPATFPSHIRTPLTRLRSVERLDTAAVRFQCFACERSISANTTSRSSPT